MEVFLKNILRQSFVIMSAFALLFGLAYATDFFTSMAASSDTNDPVFVREILSYELHDGGIVAYDYVAGQLPERLHPSEVLEKRTESSFTKRIGMNQAGENIYELVAYPDKAFIERDGEWFARETGRTTYANLAAIRQGSPIASLFWERAYATTISPFAGAGDGGVEYQDIFGTWADVHDAATGDAVNSTGTTFEVSAANLVSIAAGYKIVRGFLPFDTASIPAAATISSASLNEYVTAKSNNDNDGNDYVTVVRTTQATHTTLATADYDATGTTEGVDSGQRKDITGVSTSAYLSFTLNSTGLGWIAKSGVASNCSATTGITCLGLREGHDLLNDSIVGGAANTNRLTFSASEETGTSQDPYLSVTYTAPGGSSSLSKPPNNLGLVGYWSFNEATSTQATDFSGNGNHGTLQTFAYPTTAASGWVQNGKRGPALQFDGSSDEVTTADINATEGIQKMTISVWIKADALVNFANITSKFNTTNGWTFQTGGSGAGGSNDMVFYPDTGGSGDGVYTNSNAHVAGVWEHWVMRFDGTVVDDLDSVDFFKDGVEVSVESQTAGIGNTTDSNTSLVTIGGDNAIGGPDNEFDGVIDEVRIYNRALSDSEIAALFSSTGGAVRVGASSKTLQQGTTLGSGLVGHWTFDGSDFTDRVYDGSGNGNNGYVFGIATTSMKTIGKLGQGAQFNGSGVSYVDVGSAAMLDNLTTMSVCTWVNRTGLATNYGDLVSKGTDGVGGWGLYTLANFEALGFQGPLDGVEYGGGGQFPTGTWVHVCATWDGGSTDGSILLYRNGAATGQIFYESGNSFNDSAINLKIGGNPSGVNPVPAVMDDVRLYNRALTAAEIKKLYNLGQLRIRQ